jgi:DNA replication protein DnaC
LTKKSLPKLLRNANVGKRYWDIDLDGLSPECEHREAVLSYLANLREHDRRGLGLILHGPHGVGKTATISALIRDAIRRGPITAWFATAQSVDWAARHRDSYLGPQGVPVWKMLTKFQFVAIDDVGAERDAEWNTCWLEEVVRARYNDRLITLISSNVELDFLFDKCKWLKALSKDAFVIIEMSGKQWRDD